MAKNFIYKDILQEFKSYLDSNHSESIYFETLILAKSNENSIDLSYRKIIKNDIFSLNKVLDDKGTIAFTNDLRSLGKIRKYEVYAYDKLNCLTQKSDLEDRLNSIQAICSFSHFSKRNIFYDAYDHNENFPVSVKLSYQNFDIQFSNEPFTVLSNLLETLNANKSNVELYSNFLDYYYSKETIVDLISEYSTRTKKNYNNVAFLVAVIWVFLLKEKMGSRLNLNKHVLNKVYKQLEEEIPKSLDDKFNISEQIKLAISEM